MIVTRPATAADAAAISTLLEANGAARGGALFGDWPVEVVARWIDVAGLVVVAVDGARLLGALFTCGRDWVTAPPAVAMLQAWPGQPDAYVYGPVCVDQAARGQGVLEAMYADLVARWPGREAILFIKASNAPSLRAHQRLGMAEVACFTLRGEVFLVLSSKPVA
ncbi:GNAT family N-acetyltransferase [Bradyrhizobium sp. 2TAF24]|uniref:GNAT family N-acetyltransferase n=1 Tax=Bradyrhizobium sp. 2TAF24 TaxID=3233011 RepID=UPI003F93AEEF